MVSEKIFFHYKSMGAIGPRGMASLDPMGFIDWIFVGDHLELLNTKNISCWPYSFREEIVSSYSHY